METKPCVLRRAMGKGKAEGGVWVAAQVVRRERGKFTRSDEQGCWGKRREGRDPLAPQPLRRTNGHVPSSSQRGRGRIGLAASRGRLACGSLAPASKNQFQPDFRSLDMHGCILQSIHAAHSAHTHHTVFSQPFWLLHPQHCAPLMREREIGWASQLCITLPSVRQQSISSRNVQSRYYYLLPRPFAFNWAMISPRCPLHIVRSQNEGCLRHRVHPPHLSQGTCGTAKSKAPSNARHA